MNDKFPHTASPDRATKGASGISGVVIHLQAKASRLVPPDPSFVLPQAVRRTCTSFASTWGPVPVHTELDTYTSRMKADQEETAARLLLRLLVALCHLV